MLQQYVKYGIIENVRREPLKSGLVKKYYKLSDLGLSLLYVLEKLSENCKARKGKVNTLFLHVN
jgi:DNA-binding PadR family transcriptional regulator